MLAFFVVAHWRKRVQLGRIDEGVSYHFVALSPVVVRDKLFSIYSTTAQKWTVRFHKEHFEEDNGKIFQIDALRSSGPPQTHSLMLFIIINWVYLKKCHNPYPRNPWLIQLLERTITKDTVQSFIQSQHGCLPLQII